MNAFSLKWLIPILCIAVVFVPIALAIAGEGKDDDEKKVSLDSVPDAVKQSIQKESAGKKIEDIAQTTKGGQTVYEADIIDGGKKIEVRVAADGKVLSKKAEGAGDDDEKDGNHERKRVKAEKSETWTDSFNLGKCTFASTGRNDFFILEPGYQLVLEDEKKTNKLEITVLNDTVKIGNVETRVVEERETSKGQPKEVSRNFFAFCKETGSIFYFGEETTEYKNGQPKLGNDSWKAEGAAKPGLLMPGLVLVGARYYQELAPGKAMDRAEIVSVNETFKTPAGKFEHCLKTEETTPLEAGEREYKLYAPGIGLIKDEDLLLTHYGMVAK